MSDQKYYVPAIEDIFIGYQCEARFIDSRDYETWHKVAIQSGGNNSIAFTMANAVSKSVELRTAFLTREDIEGEGWYQMSPIYYRLSTRNTEDLNEMFTLILQEDKRIDLRFSKGDFSRATEDVLFNGYCLSINELRKICKMVGIEKIIAVKA